jgi:hypothetical protein
LRPISYIPPFCMSISRNSVSLDLTWALPCYPRCDELWCYGDRVSPGMSLEIEEADRLGIPVYRVMEQENGFIVGKVKYSTPAEAPSLAMGMV